MSITQKSNVLNALEFQTDQTGTLTNIIAHNTLDIGDDAHTGTDGNPITIGTSRKQESIWASLTPTQRSNAQTLFNRAKAITGA